MKDNRNYILDGIGLKYLGNEHKFLATYEQLCTISLSEIGLEEIHLQTSCNQIEVSAYCGNVLFSLECVGTPNSVFCDGETFRNSLLLCIQAIGSIRESDVCSALTSYYTKLGFQEISLKVHRDGAKYGSENTICGSVEKNDIVFTVKLSFDQDALVCSFGAPIIPAAKQEKRAISIDNIEGHEFEFLCADILRNNNYENVTVTQGSGDQGIDIIAYRDGIKYGIQCKCYSSPIGNRAVQEVFAGKTFYQCHVGIVLTNNYFTTAAVELAQRNGIVLWDRNKLLQMIENAG